MDGSETMNEWMNVIKVKREERWIKREKKKHPSQVGSGKQILLSFFLCFSFFIHSFIYSFTNPSIIPSTQLNSTQFQNSKHLCVHRRKRKRERKRRKRR